MINLKSYRCLAHILCVTVIAAGSFILPGKSAWAANNCIQDVWKAHGNSQNLNCTANDVTLASVDNICIVVDPPGGPLDQNEDGCADNNTCVSGQPVTFTADFTLPLTAQARYDIAAYIATDGGGSDGAVTGQCASSVVTAENAVPPSNFINLDVAPDICGDIDDAHNPQVFTQEVTVMCTDTNGDNKVNLPWCTTWRQPGANEECDSPALTEVPADYDAYPGAPSKCNCGDLDIGIFLETASIQVIKTAVPTEIPETGGNVTYHVSVMNNALVASITLDSFVDDIYGDITKATPDNPKINSTTCTLATIPAGNVAGNPYTCTFTVAVLPGDTGGKIDDEVTACGTDEFNHPNICDKDPAQVTYTDVFTNPSLEKQATSYNVATEVTFSVSVNNLSDIDTLTLNNLTDNMFGNITVPHAAENGYEEVVSTDCAIGGDIAPLASYSCTFVGRITTTGQHTNVISGQATDDDNKDYGPSDGLQDNAQVNISVIIP